MSNLFNQDFLDFLQSLNSNEVKYILVGGYAVILHGYIRSTGDMDIWVGKTKENFEKLNKALNEFGAPSIAESEFLGNEFDVWGLGREPNRIEIMSEVKSLRFEEAFKESLLFEQENLKIRYIHFNHLLETKNAVGRFKDKNDVEQLKKSKRKL
jgi:hypothetical protein